MADGQALPQRSGTVATRTTTMSSNDEEAMAESDYSAVSLG